MYKKILCIVVGIALSLFGLLPGLWDELMIRFVPKVVLGTALQESFTQLQERFEKDPVLLLLNTLDPEGKQTAEINLETEKQYIGSIQYDMVLQMEPHILSGQGTVRSNQLALNLDVYADTDFMAVSSEDLVSGQYYGITYDTFLQDVEKIPLLTWLTGSNVLQKWNANILRIQTAMEKGYPVVQLPVLASSDLQKVLLYVIAAPSDTQKIQMAVNGEMADVHQVSYTLEDPDATEILLQLIGLKDVQAADVIVDFYLYEKELVAIDLEIEAETLTKSIHLEIGPDASTDPITAVITTEEGSATSQKNIHVETYSKSPVFSERWDFSSTGKEDVSLYYEWQPDSGDMLLRINDSEDIPLNFTGTDDGVKIEADDFSGIFQYIQKRTDDSKQPISGSVIIRKGSSIVTPNYRNLDQWSMEDFLILLEGVGSLLGFSF